MSREGYATVASSARPRSPQFRYRQLAGSWTRSASQRLQRLIAAPRPGAPTARPGRSETRCRQASEGPMRGGVKCLRLSGNVPSRGVDSSAQTARNRRGGAGDGATASSATSSGPSTAPARTMGKYNLAVVHEACHSSTSYDRRSRSFQLPLARKDAMPPIRRAGWRRRDRPCLRVPVMLKTGRSLPEPDLSFARLGGGIISVRAPLRKGL
jgi:hypothetical protein